MKLVLLFLICCFGLHAQQIQWTSDQIKQFSTEYTGPRTADGRPQISDALLKRLKTHLQKKLGAICEAKDLIINLKEIGTLSVMFHW